jgi:hypothetical protein
VSYPAFAAPATIIARRRLNTTQFGRGGPQLHIETKISPLETACIFNGFVSVAARFERRQAEPRLPDMCEVL